ncbi:MarC family protein [Pirellulimonas nuda]|uniref:MarC family protein n=1 Tax=Pirellulimonas nuda TaxID=2528009 RepID=UPI001E55348A|nr:MarC family protein [Pirellulimonas nuda]
MGGHKKTTVWVGMNDHIQAIVTVLSLVNPGICAAMFAKAEAGRSRGSKLTDAAKAAMAILVILTVAALAGARLLHLFGVSLDAFMVAGGGVLAWMGFSMLSHQPADSEPDAAQSLTPLIMFAASPGTITGVITLSAAHSQLKLPVTALTAIVVAVASTWLVMVIVACLPGRRHGGGFLRDTLTRFMGLIVLAMGVQFALTGYHAFVQKAM